MSDRFDEMYDQQRDFNQLLHEHRGQPVFPLDLKTKQNQQYLKSLTHECMHELFEANLLLKNSKKHRATIVEDFDRESYKEELCDALHYLLGIVVYSGISKEEFFEAYMKKGQINVDRIKSGY
jgi:NTP pyrophosphatase (non-canonical NTP hydrolase)